MKLLDCQRGLCTYTAYYNSMAKLLQRDVFNASALRHTKIFTDFHPKKKPFFHTRLPIYIKWAILCTCMQVFVVLSFFFSSSSSVHILLVWINFLLWCQVVHVYLLVAELYSFIPVYKVQKKDNSHCTYKNDLMTYIFVIH